MSATPTINYPKTDEAPALATYSLLPVVQAFTKHAGINVETYDISPAGRILAAYRIVFQHWMREAARVEFRHGGHGYHEKWFPNLVTLLGGLDEAESRRRVLEP